MSDMLNGFLLVLTVAAVILIVSMAGELNRQRIRDHVEASGGEVIDMARRWFGGVGGRYATTYDVTYKTRHGKRVTATCITGMMRGVHWVSDRPPDGGMETYEQAEAAEPIRCLECGAKIPAGKTHCPHCGWSYAAAPGQE